MAGVTTEGFEQKTLEDLKAEIEDAERAAFGPGINTLATSVFGQLNGVFAGKLAELWEVAAAIYRSLYPDSASGEALDNVASITGALRLAARKSSAEDVICTGTAGTVLAVGRVLSVSGAGDRFASTAAATLAAATAWAPTTAYAVGNVRSNSGNIYVVTVAGTSAASGGPSGTGAAIVDGTVTWRFVGTGLAFALVDFESEEFGPINAPAFTLSVIETPVSGWSGAANRLDAELGRDVESDADFRVRREQLLGTGGDATIEAIRAAVLGVEGVTEAFVFDNPTDVTDVDGLPPHSVEVVVLGGTDEDLAEAIFGSVAAGIATHGSTTEIVTDSQGFSHTIKFSRPTELLMYVDVTVVVDAGLFPLDGVDQVKAAIVAEGDRLGIGDDVITVRLKCASLEVSGVTDVTVLEVDDVAFPSSTSNHPVAVREVARFDTSRVVVTVA
jgi:uncharacterized phage protein gp47/JayE